MPAATEDRWVEVRSSRFIVFSNAGEAVAKGAAHHLECLAQTLEQTTKGLRVDSARTVRLYVFRDLDTFRPYRLFRDDEYGVSVGFQATGEDADYIAYFTPERESSLGFASHEYIHAVIARNVGPVPLWVNEGMAEYYSTFQPRRDGADVGNPIPSHMAWLRDHMLPLRELFLMGGESPDYRGGERRGTIYAQSWALVHELFHGSADSRQRFGGLLTRLAASDADATAFDHVYGPGARDSLELVLRRRVTDMAMPSVQWKFDFEKVPMRVRVLDAIETWTILGELLAHMDTKFASLSNDHLEVAWGADSSRLLPAALMGRNADAAGDNAGAARWFETVRRAPAAEPRALGLVGSALASRRMKTRLLWHSTGPDSNALTARSLLTRALEGQPGASEWLIPLGLTYLDDTVAVSEGIGVLLQAQESWPRHPDLSGALAVLNLRAGSPGATLALYDRIPKGEHRAYWRANVVSLILREAWDRSYALALQGHCVDAESVMVRTCRRLTESWVTSECEERIAYVRKHCSGH